MWGRLSVYESYSGRAGRRTDDDDGCAEDGLPLKSTGVRPGDENTTRNIGTKREHNASATV